MNFPRKVRFCVHFVPSNSHLLSISCYAINYNVHRVIQAPSTEPCMSWVVTQTMQRSDLQDATSPAFGRTISEGLIMGEMRTQLSRTASSTTTVLVQKEGQLLSTRENQPLQNRSFIPTRLRAVLPRQTTHPQASGSSTKRAPTTSSGRRYSRETCDQTAPLLTTHMPTSPNSNQ